VGAQGLTVDEIASRLIIPRSTVGYYVRKFNRYAKGGTPIPLPNKYDRHETETLALQAFYKAINLDDIIQGMKQGEAQEIYYKLSVIRLMMQLNLLPTAEEVKALQEALKPRPLNEINFPQAPKQVSPEEIAETSGQLEKIFPET
jgi:hypothetical protein